MRRGQGAEGNLRPHSGTRVRESHWQPVVRPAPGRSLFVWSVRRGPGQQGVIGETSSRPRRLAGPPGGELTIAFRLRRAGRNRRGTVRAALYLLTRWISVVHADSGIDRDHRIHRPQSEIRDQPCCAGLRGGGPGISMVRLVSWAAPRMAKAAGERLLTILEGLDDDEVGVRRPAKASTCAERVGWE